MAQWDEVEHPALGEKTGLPSTGVLEGKQSCKAELSWEGLCAVDLEGCYAL